MLGRLLPPTTPGRAICIAAGNEGDYKRHAVVTVSKTQPAILSWRSRSPKGETIRIFTTDAAEDELSVRSLSDQYVRVDKPTVRQHYDENGKPIRSTRSQAIASRRNASAAKDTVQNNRVRLESNSDKPLRVDAYLFSDDQLAFFDNFVNLAQIGEPATAESAICVGSYNFNAEIRHGEPPRKSASGEEIVPGEISGYSNAGYIRPFDKTVPLARLPMRAVKPELVAPGQWYVAPTSAFVEFQFEVWDTGRCKYGLHNGTSAATPYTAGFIALLMQKNPKLSADDFRALLKTPGALGRDNNTGDTPNPQWGYGKLNLDACKRILDAWK